MARTWHSSIPAHVNLAGPRIGGGMIALTMIGLLVKTVSVLKGDFKDCKLTLANEEKTASV